MVHLSAGAQGLRAQVGQPLRISVRLPSVPLAPDFLFPLHCSSESPLGTEQSQRRGVVERDVISPLAKIAQDSQCQVTWLVIGPGGFSVVGLSQQAQRVEDRPEVGVQVLSGVLLSLSSHLKDQMALLWQWGGQSALHQKLLCHSGVAQCLL